MRRVNQYGLIIVLLITSTSVLAAEQSLESGYFKWLLHLGPSPTDRIFHGLLRRNHLDFFGEEATIRPSPGEIYDFSDSLYRATSDLMIWTLQYCEDGFFAVEPLEGDFMQYYHIYIFSPEQRQARLRFRAAQKLRFWNNGELIFEIDGWGPSTERYEDFVLHGGINSMTFKLNGNDRGSYENCFAARITDRNDDEYMDLTYSLSPPIPVKDVSVRRLLPAEYDPGHNIDVTLSLEITPQITANKLTIIEYVPESLSVADPGGGSIIGNTIQWSLHGDDVETLDIQYSLVVPSSYMETIAFLGYIYYDKTLEEIIGDCVVFEVTPPFLWDTSAAIETIDIDTEDYSRAENVSVCQTQYPTDYSASLENWGRGLVTGLKPHQTDGWAEYEFSVSNAGKYHIVLDYGELWTMFHHASDVAVTIDEGVTFETQLFPTTHAYGYPYGNLQVERAWLDPDRKSKWIVASVDLSPGSHTLRLTFPEMYSADSELDRFTDGRPVITKIILTNYPGLTLPYLPEPHHLDSYEHPPSRIVHGRDIQVLPDGRVEMIFHSTFHSLSQGNEIYFADGYVRPRSGQNEAVFEIVSIEPEVFHMQPDGEQDLMLVVRSKEVVPDDYSELVVVWLQGIPSSPARKSYLFTTAQNYVELPPYKQAEFTWDHSPIFILVTSESSYVKLDITDPAEMFVPSKEDLGFDRGRYGRDLPQFFMHQFRDGNLPSVEAIFQDRGWEYDNHGLRTWGQIWSGILASTYWRDSTAQQAKAYVKRLSENLVFYPVTVRWDWARPEYLPPFAYVPLLRGIAALAPAVRISQEQMIDDNEQFKILHNLVLPIFNSYWSELRTVGILAEDVNEGDVHLPVSRPFYGATGCAADGFATYLKISEDILTRGLLYGDSIHQRWEPVSRSYPKGSVVSSWAFDEAKEFECRDIMSLIATAAASRDRSVVDEVMRIIGEILGKQNIFLEDGSFKNEPGSYGSSRLYPAALLKAQRLFGKEAISGISPEAMHRIHESMIRVFDFPFSNGMVPHLNYGGCMNQLKRNYFGHIEVLESV